MVYLPRQLTFKTYLYILHTDLFTFTNKRSRKSNFPVHYSAITHWFLQHLKRLSLYKIYFNYLFKVNYHQDLKFIFSPSCLLEVFFFCKCNKLSPQRALDLLMDYPYQRFSEGFFPKSSIIILIYHFPHSQGSQITLQYILNNLCIAV